MKTKFNRIFIVVQLAVFLLGFTFAYNGNDEGCVPHPKKMAYKGEDGPCKPKKIAYKGEDGPCKPKGKWA